MREEILKVSVISRNDGIVARSHLFCFHVQFLNNGDAEVGSTSSQKGIDDRTNQNDESSFGDSGNVPQPSDVDIEAPVVTNDVATEAAAAATTDVATEEELLAFARKSGDGCGENDAGSIQ